MALPKLTIVPVSDGFTVGDPNEVVSVELDGGLPRQRRDIVGGARPVSLRWQLSSPEYDSLMDFYEATLANGALPFLIDLPLRRSAFEECVATFAPNTLRLDQQSGDTWWVSAQLKVIPSP